MFKGMDNLRNKEETSRVGKKWLLEEDEELMKELIDKKSYEEIALNHKRTIGGIKSRVICNILYLHYKDKSKTIEELSLEYNIENDLVIKYINKMENKDSDKNDNLKYINKMENKDSELKTKINIQILYEKIISLENKMLSIEKKLDTIISLKS
jgi:hypothetical protein